MRFVYLIFCSFFWLLLSACDRDGVGDPRTVQENMPSEQIFALAEAEVAKGNHQNAGDYYMEVERLYPFTPEAERALLLAAESYHKADALVESRIAAERFLQFFPGSPNAPYARYLVALSYYDGIVDISRDQERTFMALKEFQTLMDTYPDSPYAKEAEAKFEVCLDQLAGKEMEIGRYYLRRKHYTAALGRFKAVITEYPANNHTAEAYHRMIECYLSLGLVNEANATFEKFRAFSTESEWFARSQSLLQTGTQPDSRENWYNRAFTS